MQKKDLKQLVNVHNLKALHQLVCEEQVDDFCHKTLVFHKLLLSKTELHIIDDTFLRVRLGITICKPRFSEKGVEFDPFT